MDPHLDHDDNNMPPELLAQIFSLLTNNDRLKARQTCKYWRNVCQLPDFWRKRRFNLRGISDEENWRVSKYIKKFGRDLKHLNISLSGWWLMEGPTIELVKRPFDRIYHAIFDIMHLQAQLQSFYLQRLDLLLYEDPDHPDNVCVSHRRKDILTALVGMFERQKCLRAVGLVDLDLDEVEGDQLLLSLFSPETASKITTLALRNFFTCGYRFNVDRCPGLLEVMGRFPMLESLDISHRFLSEIVLNQLLSSCPALKRIMLDIDWPDTELLASPSMPDWQAAANENPELRLWLNVILVGKGYVSRFEFVQPVMPLVGLSLEMRDYTEADYGDVVKYDDEAEEEMAKVTGRIRQHRLRSFILQLPRRPGAWNRPQPLIDLVTACPSLTLLCMQMTLSLDTLLQLAAAAHQRRGREGEEDGHSDAAVTPSLRIHIGGCDTVREKEVMESLRVVLGANSRCTVQVCPGCQAALSKPAFV